MKNLVLASYLVWIWELKRYRYLNYFKYTCTMKLKLYNYHRVFVLIYFSKIRKVEFALKWLHFFLAVKQNPLFDKLEKTKELLLTVFWEKIT